MDDANDRGGGDLLMAFIAPRLTPRQLSRNHDFCTPQPLCNKLLCKHPTIYSKEDSRLRPPLVHPPCPHHLISTRAHSTSVTAWTKVVAGPHGPCRRIHPPQSREFCHHGRREGQAAQRRSTTIITLYAEDPAKIPTSRAPVPSPRTSSSPTDRARSASSLAPTTLPLTISCLRR